MFDSFKKKYPIEKKTALFGAGIVMLALIIRLIYLYEVSKNPTFLIPIIDSKAYDMIARELVENKEPIDDFVETIRIDLDIAPNDKAYKIIKEYAEKLRNKTLQIEQKVE